MQDRAQLQQQLNGKRIDAFLQQYPQTKLPPEQPEAELAQEYARWTKTMQTVNNLLADSNKINSKDWVVHSSPANQFTAAVLRKAGKMEVRHSFRLTRGLEALCKRMADPQGYSELLPFCVETREVQVKDDLEKQLLIRFKLPFLNERVLLLRLLAIDRLDHNQTIVVYGQGPSQEEITAMEKQKTEWVKLRSFVAEMRIGQSQYEVNTRASFDDSFNSLPDFILKKLLQLSSAGILSNLKSLVKDTGSSRVSQPGNERVMRCIEQRLRLKYPGRL